MNDRDQARAELAELAQEFIRPTSLMVSFIVAHPDLVLRALGLQVRWFPADGGEQRAWVEPPTDQGSET